MKRLGNLSKKRRLVIVFYIVMLCLLITLIAFTGIRSSEMKMTSQLIEYNLYQTRTKTLDILIRSQSNELIHISEVWHNWDWGDSESNADLMFEHFINRTVIGRLGSDGRRIVLVFGDENTLLYSGAVCKNEQEGIQNIIATKTNILYPDTFESNGIYWNKIIIPTPSSMKPQLIIFYGFSEDVILHSIRSVVNDVELLSLSLVEKNDTIFTIHSVMMLVVLLIGLLIVSTMREAEREVVKGFYKGVGSDG